MAMTPSPRRRRDGVVVFRGEVKGKAESYTRKRNGGKGLTKSRRLELLARARLLQKLRERALGDIRSVREVVGAAVVQI